MTTRTSRRWLMLPLAAFAVGALGMFAIVQGNSRKASVADVVVALKGETAIPSVVSVAVGKSVEFASRDLQQHDIGQGSGKDEAAEHAGTPAHHDHPAGGIESGVFGAGQSYQLKFSKAGTYVFHDHLHPQIEVTVVAYVPDLKEK